MGYVHWFTMVSLGVAGAALGGRTGGVTEGLHDPQEATLAATLAARTNTRTMYLIVPLFLRCCQPDAPVRATLPCSFWSATFRGARHNRFRPSCTSQAAPRPAGYGRY